VLQCVQTQVAELRGLRVSVNRNHAAFLVKFVQLDLDHGTALYVFALGPQL
jgi:hypothetical protein